MRLSVRQAEAGNGVGADNPISLEHRPEREPHKIHAGVGQEASASRAGASAARGVFAHGWRSLHRIETKSLWFKSTCTNAERARASGELAFFPSEAKESARRARPVAHSSRSESVAVLPSIRSKAQLTKAPRVSRPLPISLSITSAISPARLKTIALLESASACCGTIVSWRRQRPGPLP